MAWLESSAVFRILTTLSSSSPVFLRGDSMTVSSENMLADPSEPIPVAILPFSLRYRLGMSISEDTQSSICISIISCCTNSSIFKSYISSYNFTYFSPAPLINSLSNNKYFCCSVIFLSLCSSKIQNFVVMSSLMDTLVAHFLPFLFSVISKNSSVDAT